MQQKRGAFELLLGTKNFNFISIFGSEKGVTTGALIRNIAALLSRLLCENILYLYDQRSEINLAAVNDGEGDELVLEKRVPNIHVVEQQITLEPRVTDWLQCFSEVDVRGCVLPRHRRCGGRSRIRK